MSWSDCRRSVVLLVAATLLAACGFRMQGAERFPAMFASTYIEASDDYTLFYRKLAIELEQGDVKLVESAVDASAVIRIESDESGQRILTISAFNVPTEYEVFYRIRYSVWKDGIEILPPQSLSFTQAYTFDPTLVLGKNREGEEIREALALRLARQVSRQLALL
jgi:LPS-assembly lipoprotein